MGYWGAPGLEAHLLSSHYA